MIRRLEERAVLAMLAGSGVACLALTVLYAMAVAGRGF